MYLTYLDSNSWLIDVGHTRILLDPWLVGDLVFGGAPWLFRGVRTTPRPLPETIDLILLSQGLADHAHPETLKALDRKIPVVASPPGARVARSFGYQQVTALAHGETFQWFDRLTIQAFPGSPVGPLLTENAYLITDQQAKTRLYYEPHGHHAPTLQQEAPVDVIITPILSQELPLAGAIIQGQEAALNVARWLRPQVMLPTAAGGDISMEGLVGTFLKTVGSLDDFQQQLQQEGLATRVMDAQPGDRLEIQLTPASAKDYE